ncbi:MAG: methyltransferase domain-containing protein, partial [Lentisphaeria bacterium]|nr:methyltransferase domain-containing protein [Lentisphaeria bacterium]
TQALLRCFTDVSAVEPNANMRNEFKKLLPDIIFSDGSGEATKLAADSVDLITVAQAFHWLDADLFKQEAMRILRNNGKVAIVWNTSLQSDFTCERNKICQKYCPRFRSGHAGKHSPEEGDRFLRNTFFRSVEVVSFNNPFVMDKETFEGNIRSRSYALAPQDAGYGDFMAELRNVFNKYAENGTVTEPQATQIYLGSF